LSNVMVSRVALVTGGSGYIATQLISDLIKSGRYKVRTTVRSTINGQWLQKLFPQIQLFQADLLKEGSFDEAVKGAQIVFHTASPFPAANPQDPQKDLIDPAVQGTLNVLRSVDKSGTVKRVVLTSSVAAIARGKPESYRYSEKDWNLESKIETAPYPLSKKLAEEAAWKFAKGKTWELAVICPSFVIGPILSDRQDATSIKAIKALLEGKYKETQGGLAFGAISVEDISKAHILAAEKKEAAGNRYLVSSSESVTRQDFNDILIKSGQFNQFPLKENQFKPPVQRFKYDNSKVQQLGVKLTSIPETLVGMAHSLLKFGVVSAPLQSKL